MLYFILHLFNVIASQSVSAPVASVSAVSASPSDKSSTTLMPASTSSAMQGSTLNPKEICVKCYNDFVTPDCTNTCSCTCEDGSEKTKVIKKPSLCPNVDPSEVPCACKDGNNNIIPGNSYVKGIAAVDNIGN